MTYHPLLERQLRNAARNHPEAQPDRETLLAAISEAYAAYEKTQRMRDHAFDLVSAELMEQRQKLEQQVTERTEELQHAMEHAESANRLKSDFLATMSHEIRTPLNGVIGTADILGRTELTPLQDDYVRMIRKSAESLLYVLNDILDLTKLEAQQLGLETIPFNFSQTVEDVVDIHSGTAAKKEIDLLLRYAPGTPEFIVADPGRLRQVMSNLLSNSLKFTEQGYVMLNVETVEDTLAPTSAMLYVSVEDTGIGIPPEKQTLIFERFSQAEASTTRKYGGSGLGLSICKQLVELMGGQIGVESTVGQGSRFWFTLPVQLDRPQPLLVGAESLEGKRVLVVDDNPVNLRILKEQIEYWQGQPFCFESGEEVLTFLESAGEGIPFDVAIVDHDMPLMDGATLGEYLRNHPLTSAMPMMIFSSYGSRGDKGFFEERGFAGYLVKPSRPEDIHRMLLAVLGWVPGVSIITRYQLEDIAPAEEDSPDTCKQTSPFRGMKVLVVEDDLVNQRVTRLLLEEVGCDVAVASSGKVAVDACRDTTFDLVFMDMQMPEMDGQEAARHIRDAEKLQNKPHMPIVALTANAMKEHEDLCLKAGMDAYMTKPVTLKKLTDQMGQWFWKDRPRAAPDLSKWEKVWHIKSHTKAAGEALDHLKNLVGDDPQVLQDVLKLFEQSAEECLGHLEIASATGNREHWKAYAHRLKGAAANVGFADLSAQCATAEKDFETLDLPASFTTLRQSVQETLKSIPGMLRGM